MADSDIEAAKRLAMQMLARRSRSEAEVRARLERQGFAPEVVAAAIERLRELRFLDDAAFARDRSRKLLGEGKLGPSGVERRLLAHGLSEEAAASAVRDAQGDIPEIDLARRYLSGLRPPVDHSSPVKSKARAARALLSRGFSEETVRQLLDLTDERSPE